VQNRLTVLDCSLRLAKHYGATPRYEDMFTVIRRVTADAATSDEALDRYYDLVRPGGPPRPTNALDALYTPQTLSAKGVLKTFDGASATHFRRMVWWNRSGDPLWAYVVMPTTYLSRSNWPAIVMAHGGGWREGEPDDLQIYATRLAARGYVVFLTAYRLTIMPGYSSPAQQRDLADLVGLVKASPAAFGIDPAKVGLFGLSAGGHRSQDRSHPVAEIEVSTSSVRPG
jgi:acetyl esterase/lipase